MRSHPNLKQMYIFDFFIVVRLRILYSHLFVQNLICLCLFLAERKPGRRVVAFHCMIVALFQQRQMVRILGWELMLFVKSIDLSLSLKGRRDIVVCCEIC